MSRRKSGIREWFEAIFISILLIMGVRLFLFDLVVIPTTSMEKSILPGDFVLINKISYGPRTPITPLSIPFTHQTLPLSNNRKSFSEIIQLPYFRIPGTSKIKQNDLLLFNYPMETDLPIDRRTYFLKRCVGLSGDTIEIKNNQVYVNQHPTRELATLQFDYIVKSKRKTIPQKELHDLGITEGGKLTNGHWQFSMSKSTADKLQNHHWVESVTMAKEQPQLFLDHIFPFDDSYGWSRDNFGPLYIPRKGDSVKINTNNLPLYHRILTEYEGNALEVKNGSIYLNGNPVDHYTFRMNYYFVLGDNRHNSGDSRFWGFVPEDHVTGKAKMVLFSIDKGKDDFRKKIRWNRVFKSIN